MKGYGNRIADFCLSKELQMEEGASVEVLREEIIVRGPKGELRKRYNDRILDVTVDGSNRVVVLRVFNPRRFEASYINTMKSHVRNMMVGVTKGFRKTMITAFAHFPMRLEVDERGKRVLIQNFLGEKRPRTAKIVGDTKVRVEERDRIVIEGPSKEDVSQTAANLRLATKIKKRDPRVFMDGVYVLREE